MRKPIAILCSGQGGQHRGMFALVAEATAAQPIFHQAAEVLGQDPRQLVQKATDAELFANRTGQILCCTQALAVWAALGGARPSKAVVAGYSVGELAAWGCGGLLDSQAVLCLAARRAELMDDAAPQDAGLAGIIGLPRGELEALFPTPKLSIAIINGAASFVVGGQRYALEQLCQAATQQGAQRAKLLPVAVPSHTPVLKAATDAFAEVLGRAKPKGPGRGYRVLAGVDGDTLWSAEEGIDKLSRQICTTIDWQACLESCRAAGATAALELGPGRALARMAGNYLAGGEVRSVEDFHTLAGLQDWLRRR